MRKLLVLLLLSFAARGSTFSTDISDMWWNPNENGWGLNITQQSEVLFLTMFAYNQAGQPIWFVGPQTSHNGSSNLVFTGPWFQVTGSYFGGQFNPSTTNARQVGNVTFTLSPAGAGTLTYSADGVSVTKALQRQTWRTNNLAGSYMGGSAGTYSGNCPRGTGYSEETGSVTVTQSTNAITLHIVSSTGTCNFSGNYSQLGRMGESSGTFTCTSGGSGNYQAIEIEGTRSGFTLIAQETAAGCSWLGRVGGLRRGAL